MALLVDEDVGYGRHQFQVGRPHHGFNAGDGFLAFLVLKRYFGKTKVLSRYFLAVLLVLQVAVILLACGPHRGPYFNHILLH